MSNEDHISGPAALLANAGTLHSIELPPEDATDEEYDAWYVRTHCWHVSTRPEADSLDR